MPHSQTKPHSPHAEKFVGAIFSGSELRGRRFEDCEFDNCDFKDLLIQDCIFIDCRFTSCNLSFVKLDGSEFINVEFYTCKLLGVNWANACWQGLMTGAGLSFKQSIINSSSFFALTVPGIKIIECKAQDVDFREANLNSANFTGTDLGNSLFIHTNLSDADFSDATDYSLDPRNNELKKARFSRFEALNLLASMDIELID